MRAHRLAAALVVAIGLAQHPASAQTSSASDAQASELMEQGDWAKAASVLRALVEAKPTATRLFNLGQAERNVGRLVESKRRFLAAIDAAKTEKLRDVENAASAALRELEPRLSRIEITVPSGAGEHSVRIDGREVEGSGPIELDPGQRRVFVTAPGHRAFERTVTLAEGEQLKIDAALERIPTTAPAPPPADRSNPPAPTEPNERTGGPPWPVWVLGGVGVLALAGGVAFHFVADSKFDEAGASCRADGDRWVCPTGLESDSRHQELKDDAEQAETVRNVLLAVGAGALVAGGVWWALAPGSSSSAEVGVLVTPNAATARVRVPLF